MKRISLILAAAALVLGLSQCKKQEQETQASTGGTVAITLEVKAPAGQRIDVDTDNGEVTFEQGDVVYVGSNGKYVGTLTYKGKTFKGNLTSPAANEPLYFYFLGNKDAGTLTPGQSTSCTVDISVQTGKLPVISCAESNEVFNGPGLYTAFFLNKAALVEIDLQQAKMNESYLLCLKGLDNKVTVDFTQATGDRFGVGFGKVDNEGLVKTNIVDATGTKVYAIVPPASNGLSEAAVWRGQEEVWSGSLPTTGEISANAFVTVNLAGVQLFPAGALSGKFSVSATEKVHFSQGNLQYTQTTGTWSFMTNQYGTVETLNQNVGTNYANQDIVSLFGWATGNNPTNTSTNNADYPTSFVGNDWGAAAANNIGNDWRTLTTGEWQYLFGTSNERAGKHGHGSVGGVNGVILLPDDWTLPTNLSFTSGNSYNSNSYTVEQWADMEANGAVFLPAAGYRNGTTVDRAGSYGYYWSASPNGSTFAYDVGFNDGNLSPGYYNHRYLGLSVRLVCPAEN